MKRTITLVVVLAAAAALATFAQTLGAGPLHAHTGASAHAAPAPPAAEPQRQGTEFRLSEPLAAGRTLEIRGVNGAVSAEPAAGGEFEVVAVKRSRRSDPDEVRVEVVRHAGGVLICALYPNPGGEPNTCELNNSRSHVRDHDTTVNGSINVSTTGLARAQTVNGSITALVGRADWPAGLEFKTVNGGIDLTLPASLSARVEAKTLNGEITSDFPMTVTGAISRRRLSGTIGGGGDRQLILETVNGGVQIRRAN